MSLVRLCERVLPVLTPALVLVLGCIHNVLKNFYSKDSNRAKFSVDGTGTISRREKYFKKAV
jgi:hypothetical protein